MEYRVIELDVEDIKRKTKGRGGLPRAIAELSLERAVRLMRLADNEEGSDRKGHLEEAAQQFEASYRNYPNKDVAALLSETYKALGDVKKDHSMPGYEDDYTKSTLYEERAQEASRRGPERHSRN